MNTRTSNFSMAIAWLLGVILLSVYLPLEKMTSGITGWFIGSKATLTGWTSSLVKAFTSKQATITAWSGYSQWILFLLILLAAVYLSWQLIRGYHVNRRDRMNLTDDSAMLYEHLGIGLLWGVFTLVVLTAIFAICSTGSQGTLREFIYGLVKGQEKYRLAFFPSFHLPIKGAYESRVLLGFLGIGVIVTFILMWSRNIWTIFSKELRIYFTTPIAYVVMMLFSILAGYFFTLAFSNFERYSMMYQMRYRTMAQFNLNDMVLSQTLNVFGVILLFLVPILTMRLFAEEKKNRTYELLMTAPISTMEIVLGKYFSVLVALAALLGLTFLYPIILGVIKPGTFEWGPVFTGYLGMYLLAAGLAAVGLFCSSLTENQIIAAVIAFGTLLLLWVIESAAGRMSDGVMRETVSYLSILGHLKSFIRGVVETKDVLYYVSLIFFANFLTHRVVESQRWR